MSTYIGDYRISEYSSVEGIRIVRYNGSGGRVVIPGSWRKRLVTSIGPGAFCQNDNITSVTIPSSITRLGSNCFSRCSKLAYVTFMPGVTYIDSWTFSYCESLISLTIPDSVTDIAYHAFQYCTKLNHVTIKNSVVIDSKSFPKHTIITRI